MVLIDPLLWHYGELMCAADEALHGIEAQLEVLSVRCCSPRSSSLPSFAVPLLFENTSDAVAPNFLKNNFINHVYHLINEKTEVYDEGYSVKAVLDEASSDTSSTEPLLAKRESFYHYNHCNGIILTFNIAMFCLSVTLFSISGDRLIKLDDPFDNGILRKSSEYCEKAPQSIIVGS